MNKDKVVERFEQFGVAHRFLYQNVRILLAVSGGSDSIAMAFLFNEIKVKYSIFLIVAHVNYHLRGQDSLDDEQLVRDFCYRSNIPLYVTHAKIESKSGLQKKARDIRFSYFQRLKTAYEIDFIALAHQLPDQAETLLQRFIRGAGLCGMSGIVPRDKDIIHPVLCFDKETLRHFLRKKEQAYREDRTNNENDYTRNKIRNELMPHISQTYNPLFEQRLIEFGSLCSLANDYFTAQAAKLLKKCTVESSQHQIVYNVDILKKQSPIIQFYIFRSAWQSLTRSDKDFYSVHFHDIIKIINGDKGYQKLSLPKNIQVIKEYNTITFKTTMDTINPFSPVGTASMPSAPIHDDGNLLASVVVASMHSESLTRDQSRIIHKVRKHISFNNHRFTMQRLKLLPPEGIPQQKDQIVIDFDQIKFPITLRYRQDGDRFIPFGMSQSKKLKNYFIDEKISLPLRDDIVIFTDTEKIFWVCGHRLDARVAVTEQTQNFLSISLENVNEVRNVERERH